MSLKYIIIPLLLIQYGLAKGEDKLLEIPCQGGMLLIQPKIKTIPEGFGIHFVSTWPAYPSYAVINNAESEYVANIVAKKSDSNIGAYSGPFRSLILVLSDHPYSAFFKVVVAFLMQQHSFFQDSNGQH